MELAARRPHITAGLALASAAVIAAAPMTQHLPQLDAAHYLPQVSVTDINLSDATSPMVDLFSGVENQLASLASGAAAAAVPAAALTDFINPAGLPLPLATWVDTFQAAGKNLQTSANLIQQLPFPTLQQIAANWVSYGDLYVKSFQAAAKGAVKLYTGTLSTNFWPLLSTAFTNFASGNVDLAVTKLYQAFYLEPFLMIGQPLEPILKIPGQITQSLTNGLNYMATPGIAKIGIFGFLNLPGDVQTALGQSLQAASSAWAGGDPIGAMSNLLNTPGAVVNGFLNGTNATGSNGLLSGFLNTAVLQTIAPDLAKSIVAPNAVNIATGGSLQTALQGFANQLINGWPSLSGAVSGISTGLTTLLQNVSSQMPSLLASFGATFATNIGLLISNLLKLL